MNRLLLVDGYSMLYRAYHGLQYQMNAPDGTPTNAIHAFMMMFFKAIETEKPDGVAVAFDMHQPIFRKEIYSEYKATRKPMPDDLRQQDPVIHELLALMHIPILECPGYEADDILGTVSQRCEEEKTEILLLTGDRDSYQLAGRYTTILYAHTKDKDGNQMTRVTPDYVLEKYSLKVEQLIDLKSLMGDPSDNIPGIPGIGEKTAVQLLLKYTDLDHVLEDGAAQEKGSVGKKLRENADSARMSQKLARILRDIPIETDFETWRMHDWSDALPRLSALGMVQVSKKLKEMDKSPGAPASADNGVHPPETASETQEPLPEAVPVDSAEELQKIVDRLLEKETGWVAYLEGEEFTLAAEDVFIAVSPGGDLLHPGLDPDDIASILRPLLERTPRVETWNARSGGFRHILTAERTFDVMLAAYVLNPQCPSYEAGPLCEKAGIAAADRVSALAVHRLAAKQSAELAETDMMRIFREMEMPLSFVLQDMEEAGFRLNEEVLTELGKEFDAEIERLSGEIFQLFGTKINLNSPKQLGDMLFDRMGITPAPKKTPRGYSTSAEVLEELAEAHPVCAKILEYRKYQKLLSTYIDTLIEIQDSGKRVHSHFDQVSTSTGRLSSNDPNLQNIPVRTEIGRKIRAAFIAPEGSTLVDADYSQIELRLLAHISGDENMIAAFNSGEDIHTATAAQVYGVPQEQVTPEMRSASKAVNFGIVYGISEFQLAKNIGVTRKEAGQFIQRYFARYPGVRAYLDAAVANARDKGYTQTLLGRRRYIPELSSSVFNIRSFGERVAMNAPIQGTAADIIKLAMVRVAERLRERKMKTRLILQVHDELILEAPDEEVEEASAILRDCMENVLSLRIPLVTEITTGGDWRACK